MRSNDRIKKTAYYGFTGMIEPGSATRIASAFNNSVNDGCDEIYLCLNSTGGLNVDGIFLYNHIRSLPVKVIIHNTSSVLSIALVVYVAAKERNCSKHGMFMMHPTEVSHPNIMRFETLQSLSTSALADDKRIENILSQHMSIPDETIAARRFRDVYITPQEALEFGIANTICEFTLPEGSKIVQI